MSSGDLCKKEVTEIKKREREGGGKEKEKAIEKRGSKRERERGAERERFRERGAEIKEKREIFH